MRPSSFLSGVGADADRDVVGGAVEALEVADGHRDQIRRHLRRRREPERVRGRRRARACPTADAPFEIAVSPRSIVSATANVALNAGSSKHGKRAARVGRLELGDGVAAAVGLAQVEAAQLVVEHAGVADLDLGGAGGTGLGTVKVAVCGLVERDGDGWPSAPAPIVTSRKLDLERVQDDARWSAAATWTRIVSVPSNRASARSTSKARS